MAWGQSQGGLKGRPWSADHARKRQQHLAWWIGKLNLEALADLKQTLPRVEKMLRELQDSGRAGKTLHNYREGICSFCSWTVTRGYLDKDPLEKLAGFDTTPRASRRLLSPEEFERLLEVTPPHRSLLYQVAVCTGLRANELRQLKVADLDRDRRCLNLRAEVTKNRKPGFQPLQAVLFEKLMENCEGKDPAERLLSITLHPSIELDKDLKRAKIPKWTPLGKLDFHAFRVAYISLVLESGASVKEAQALARHSSPNLTMNTYARTRPGRLHEVAEKVGEAMLPADETITYPEHARAVHESYPESGTYGNEVRDSSPPPRTIFNQLPSGPSLPGKGPDPLNPGHLSGPASSSHVNFRTQPDALKTASRSLPVHNIPITPDGLPPDLRAVVESWPGLPREVKEGIVSIIKSLARPKK